MSETPALLLKTVQAGRVIPAAAMHVAHQGRYYISVFFKGSWLSEKPTVLFCTGLHSGYVATGTK